MNWTFVDSVAFQVRDIKEGQESRSSPICSNKAALLQPQAIHIRSLESRSR